jgi:hypothetical protein
LERPPLCGSLWPPGTSGGAREVGRAGRSARRRPPASSSICCSTSSVMTAATSCSAGQADCRAAIPGPSWLAVCSGTQAALASAALKPGSARSARWSQARGEPRGS